jgi:hypothetical protein
LFQLFIIKTTHQNLFIGCLFFLICVFGLACPESDSTKTSCAINEQCPSETLCIELICTQLDCEINADCPSGVCFPSGNCGSIECIGDSECSSGACVNGICIEGDAGNTDAGVIECVGADAICPPGFVCNGATLICEVSFECELNEQCPTGAICENKQCVAGCVEVELSECTTPRCKDARCEASEVCNASEGDLGACEFFCINSETQQTYCGAGEFCDSIATSTSYGSCFDNQAELCESCEVDTDCGLGGKCQEASATENPSNYCAIPCNTDSECECGANKECLELTGENGAVCLASDRSNNGVCDAENPCPENSTCQTVGDVATSTEQRCFSNDLVYQTCSNSFTCTEVVGTENNLCISNTDSCSLCFPGKCSGNTPNCIAETGECVGCVNSDDCEANEVCTLESNRCVASGPACSEQSDCVEAGDKNICLEATVCVECLQHFDCTGAATCDNNVCGDPCEGVVCPSNFTCSSLNGYCSGPGACVSDLNCGDPVLKCDVRFGQCYNKNGLCELNNSQSCQPGLVCAVTDEEPRCSGCLATLGDLCFDNNNCLNFPIDEGTDTIDVCFGSN